MEIRDATEIDLAEILAIYNEVIANSTAVYTEQPSTLEDRRAWLAARRQDGFPVIVAADERGALGFASFGDWRGAWVGYRHTIEHTVHVRADARGGGVGTALMAGPSERGAPVGTPRVVGAVDARKASSPACLRSFGVAPGARFPASGGTR